VLVTDVQQQPPKRLSDIDKLALYTVDELAPLLKATSRTLRKYCCEGVFANATNIRGKHWLIPGQDILALYPNVKVSE
jgi:hypothetical protein